MAGLSEKTCAACRGDVPALSGEAARTLLKQLDQWEVVNGHHLHKELAFPDFRSALAFVNRVGDIAEAEGHHPDITLTWGAVTIDIWTHGIDGLTESDFILAAKIDRLPV